MFRSLHMKLVLIILLLVTSLMAVVGAFLTTSVSTFYINSFYQQIDNTFGESNEDFFHSLQYEASQPDGATRIQAMIEANAGALGIDYRTRNYYILDGTTGKFIAGSDEVSGLTLETTTNLLRAMNGEVGDSSDISASYMDAAIPLSGDENSYIIYLYDNRDTITELNHQLFMIILQALVIGLLISILLSFLLSKTMVTPIEKLTEGAERVASGDFDHKLAVESTDEIGILTTTFNDMAMVLESTLQAVENERNKLDTLFLHMTDGVVAFDHEGQQIHCNPAATTFLSPTKINFAYDDVFSEIFPLQDVRSLRRPNFLESELTIDQRTTQLYFAPFSSEDQDGGVLVVLHDVTELRKNEDRRKEFVANVSHELRTPLTNVRSYAETLRDNEDIPPDMSNNFLDIIIKETDRMTHIVQDLLSLSRLDSGQSELNMLRFPFDDAMDSVLKAVALEAKNHQHNLTWDYPEMPLIMGDRSRLEQVMMNILGNAIKYTPDGGTIHLTAGVTDDTVWMEVSDNGIGIPLEDQSRIFERFYRVDKARSREHGGTGLGLSIAQEIVNRHHGTIGLAPHEGAGTTLRLTLPILQEM